MTGNKLLDMSFEFSVYIVNLVDTVSTPKSGYMLSQLGRSGTSIGANIYEAQYAENKKDFVHKFEIALNETGETAYWLKLLHATNRIDQDTYKNLSSMCGNIRRVLIASCQTTKKNCDKQVC